MTREDVADKFREAFTDDKYTVHVQESGYGETCSLAVSKADTARRSAVIVDGFKTVDGTLGWHPRNTDDDDTHCSHCGYQGEWYWGKGPPWKHEPVGLIHTPELIGKAIEIMRRVVDKHSV